LFDGFDLNRDLMSSGELSAMPQFTSGATLDHGFKILPYFPLQARVFVAVGRKGGFQHSRIRFADGHVARNYDVAVRLDFVAAAGWWLAESPNPFGGHWLRRC
jgi:hypothetical protein